MAQSFKTEFVINGDSTGAVKAQRDARQETEQLNREMALASQRGEEMAAGFETVQSRAAVFATVVGAATTAVGTLVTSQTRAIAEQVNMARAVGVSTQALQEWQFAARAVGLEADSVGDIFKDTAEKIGEFVRTGGGEAADLFEQLNLNLKDLRQMSPDQQLLAIGKALDGVATQGEKIFFLDSLADGASRLLPLLEDNGRLLKDNADLARALGVTIPQADIDSINDANTALDQLLATGEGFANQLASRWAPAITDLANGVNELVSDLGGMDDVVDGLATATGGLAVVLGTRLAMALGTATVAAGKKLSADLALAKAESDVAAMQVKRAAAERQTAMALLSTARLEARATQGTNAHAFALAQLSAARVRAAEAAGAHAAATNASAAAMSKGAVVAGRLSSALALVGGPAGAAILAAGALYTFREELGLVEPVVTANRDRVAELTGNIDDLTRAATQNRIAKLTADLAELKTEFIAVEQIGTAADSQQRSGSGALGIAAGELGRQARAIQMAATEGATGVYSPETEARIKEYEAAIAGLSEHLEALGESGRRAGNGVSISSKAAEEAAKKAEEQAAAWKALRHEMDPMAAAHDEYVERLEVINGMLGRGEFKGNMDAYNEAIQWAAQEYVDAATGAEEYEKRLETLVGEYDRHEQKARELDLALRDINEAYRRGDISGAQYQRMLAAIRDEMRELALESDPMAQEMARAWTEAADRIDATFADAFKGAFDSFESFADQLAEGFKTLFAELAYQATLKPIVVQVTGQMQGMMGLGGQGAGASGGLGSMGNLANLGSKIYSGVTNGFGNIAWGGVNTAAQAGGLYGNVATGGLYDSIATGGVQTGGLWGGSTSNFGGMTGLASAGAGFVGSYAGNAVGEDLFGKQANSSYGRMAGTAIGTYFGGPIGAGIGSFVGGLVDTAFGSGREYGFRFNQRAEDPSVTGEDLGYDTSQGDGTPWYSSGDYAGGDLGRGRDTVYGSFGFLSKEVVEPDDMIAFLDTLEQLHGATAQFMSGEQIESVKSALDGYYYKGDDMQDVIGEQLDIIAQASGTRFADALSRIADPSTLASAMANGLQLEQLGANLGEAVATDLYAEFDEALTTGNGDVIQASADRLVTAVNALELLGNSSERLGLEFDATAQGALDAAYNMAQYAGGLDQLAALQEQYFQGFYSEAERFGFAQEDLSEAFADLGVAMPTSEAGFRDLVEAQDRMTEAGQEAYVTLLNLSPAMKSYFTTLEEQEAERLQQQQEIADERWALENELLKAQGRDTELLNRQRLRELQALDESNRSLQQRIWMIQDEASAQQEAQRQLQLSQQLALYANGTVGAVDGLLDAYNAELDLIDETARANEERYRNELQAVETLSGMLDSLALSGRSILDPLERVNEAQRQFAMNSVLAEADPTAVADLQSSGDSYLEAMAAAYGQSSAEYARAYQEVRSTYRALEDQYGDSLDKLGSLESIQEQALREQQRATDAMRAQLTQLGSIADLIDLLPSALASALEGIFPESADNSGSGFDTAAYIANKADQLNAIGYQGRNDWTTGDVQDAFAREGLTPQEHYDKWGRDEGVQPYYDGSHATGLDYVPFDGYIAELHRGESVLTADEASSWRAQSQGLPPVIMPPAFEADSRASGGADMPALLKAFDRMSADNAALREQVAGMQAQLAAIADHTGQALEPLDRTANASEATNRAMRTTSRSTA